MATDWRGRRSSAARRCVSGHFRSPRRRPGRANSNHLDEQNDVPGNLLRGLKCDLDTIDAGSTAAPGTRGDASTTPERAARASRGARARPSRSSHGLTSGYHQNSDRNQPRHSFLQVAQFPTKHAHYTNAPLQPFQDASPASPDNVRHQAWVSSHSECRVNARRSASAAAWMNRSSSASPSARRLSDNSICCGCRGRGLRSQDPAGITQESWGLTVHATPSWVPSGNETGRRLSRAGHLGKPGMPTSRP